MVWFATEWEIQVYQKFKIKYNLRIKLYYVSAVSEGNKWTEFKYKARWALVNGQKQISTLYYYKIVIFDIASQISGKY